MHFREGHITAELQVVGYQFPEIKNQPWDSDWLLLRLQLRVGEQHWERIDPAMTTFELDDLAGWLEEIADQAHVFGEWQHERLVTQIFFTEPNLSFQALNGHVSGNPVTFRLHLAAEYLPPFKTILNSSSLETDPLEVWIDFGFDSQKLRDLATHLREQLNLFPVRVGTH